jgi:hypothetical protein
MCWAVEIWALLKLSNVKYLKLENVIFYESFTDRLGQIRYKGNPVNPRFGDHSQYQSSGIFLFKIFFWGKSGPIVLLQKFYLRGF